MADALSDAVVKEANKRFGKRLTSEILLLVAGASISIPLASRHTTLAEIVAGGFWVVVGTLYFAFAYHNRVKKSVRVALFILFFLSSAAWGLGVWGYLNAATRQITQLSALAEKLANTGTFKEAALRYEKAASVAHESGNLAEEIDSRCKEGNLEDLSSQKDKAETSVSACLALAVELGDSVRQARADVLLGDLAQNKNQIDLTQQRYAEAEEQLKKKPDSDVRASLDLGLGRLEQTAGHPDRARELFLDSQAIYLQINEPKEEAQALHSLGFLEVQMGRLEDARNHLNAAMNSFQKIGYHLGEANTSFALGMLEQKTVPPDLIAARNDLEHANGLYEEMDTELGKCNVMNALGRLDEPTNADLARKDYEDAINLCQRENNRTGEAQASFWLSGLDFRQGHFPSAHERLGKARVICEQIHDASCEANVDYGESGVFNAEGRRDDAIAMLRQARLLAKQVQNFALIRTIDNQLVALGVQPSSDSSQP